MEGFGPGFCPGNNPSCVGGKWDDYARGIEQGFDATCRSGVEVQFYSGSCSGPPRLDPFVMAEGSTEDGFTAYWVVACLLIVIF